MKLITTLSFLLFTLSVYGQQVSGIITDSEGEPLIGVSVMVKETSEGTASDYDGSYSVKAQFGQTLVYSYVGYEAQEIPVDNRTQIDVQLKSDAELLDEVVVIGYGVKKQRDVIGSVSKVGAEDLTQTQNASFVAGLQGRASGVQVTQSSGVPGAPSSIKIRGVNSLSIGTDPLWIIDGIPIYSGSGLESTNGATRQDPMSLINPNDIESIEILKDAAATAIYGSRGSNGVIIITTKSGKKGKGTINVNYTGGITDLSRTPEDIGFANTTQWFDLVETARRNSNGGVDAPFDPNTTLNLFQDDPIARLTRDEAMAVNTNWFDQILRTGSFHDVGLSASQGFEKGSFFVSANYRNDQSVLRNNELERYTARANVEFRPIESFSIETRINLSYTQNDRVKGQAGGATGNNGGGNSAGFGNANRTALPWYPIFNSSHPSGYWNPMSGANLTAAIDRDLLIDEVQNYRGIASIALNYDLPWIKGLQLRSEGSIDYLNTQGLNWITATLREDGSFAADENNRRQSLNYNLYGTYNRTFGIHNFSAIIGTESQRINQYNRLMEGQNLTGTYQELGSPQDLITMRAGLANEQYLRAYFGRADYKLMDRYLVGFSFRRDGSSKFNEAFRWGLFPAVSLGWIISDEPIFANNETFSLLKLRGSYGQTGNNNIPSNRFVTTYTNRANWRYGPADFIQQGTRITNIGVPSLTWETTSSYDVGLDYGLLEGRIAGSLAYYFQDVSDLLLASPLAASAGLEGNRIWGNVGDMQNYGLEFDVNATNINKGKFKWTTDFNISTNHNRVVRLTSDLDRSGRGLISGNRVSRTSGRLWTYYMAEDAGVDPERGVNTIWEIDLDRFEQTGETVKTGRRIPATLNNLLNHRIVHEDKSSIPTYFGGLNNTFSYGAFDLSVFFSFSGGNYIYDYDEQRTTEVQFGNVVLREDLIGNTWTPDNRDAKYPELRWQGAYDWSWDPDVENAESPTGKGNWIQSTGNYKNESANWTKYLYRGDFIRLRTLQVGYQLPRTAGERLKIQGARIFLSGTNLWTWTAEYEGWDPESGGAVLPQLRTFNAGFSVQL